MTLTICYFDYVFLILLSVLSSFLTSATTGAVLTGSFLFPLLCFNGEGSFLDADRFLLSLLWDFLESVRAFGVDLLAFKSTLGTTFEALVAGLATDFVTLFEEDLRSAFLLAALV
jgi:hypothetical protein